MSRVFTLAPLADFDNPWRRLPGVLLTTLLMWSILLWAFGVMLRQGPEEAQQLKPIEAQLIEQREPPKPIAPLEPPRVIPARHVMARPSEPAKDPEPKLKRETVPPAPMQQPVVQTPAVPTTVVALPETNLPVAGNSGLSGPGLPAFEKGAKIIPVSAGEPITPPQFSGAAYLNNPKPAYPLYARKTGKEGTVLLNVFVSREGKSLKIETARSSGCDLLDNAAVEAVKRWQFIPAHQGNVALDEWAQVPITFRLKK